MKQLLILLAVLTFSSFSQERSFCDCWKEGYVEGWCMEQIPGGCVSPVVTVCPVPPVGRSTCKDGYNLGVKKGSEDYKDR